MLCQHQKKHKKCEQKAELICTLCNINTLLCFRHGKSHSSIENHGCQFIDEKILQNLNRKVVKFEVKNSIIRISEQTKVIIATINEAAVNAIKYLKSLNKNIKLIENFNSVELDFKNIPIIYEKANIIVSEIQKSFELTIKNLTFEVSKEKKRRKKIEEGFTQSQNEILELQNKKKTLELKLKTEIKNVKNQLEIIVKEKDDQIENISQKNHALEIIINDLNSIILAKDEQISKSKKKIESLRVNLEEKKKKYYLHKRRLTARINNDIKRFSSSNIEELKYHKEIIETSEDCYQSFDSWHGLEEQARKFKNLSFENKKEFIKENWSFIIILDIDKQYLLTNDGCYLFVCNNYIGMHKKTVIKN